MPKKTPKRRGPEPEHLQIKGDWKDAVKQSLYKKKPPGGWPKDKQKDS